MADFMFYQDYYELLKKIQAIASEEEMNDLLIEIIHAGVIGNRYKSPLSSAYLESVARQIISRIEISKKRKKVSEEKRLQTSVSRDGDDVGGDN